MYFMHLYLLCKWLCTVGQKKKRNTVIYFNTNYCTEMKLVPIIMDYCALQFYALNFYLRLRLHRGSLINFNFFNANLQIFQLNRKLLLLNSLEKNSQHF